MPTTGKFASKVMHCQDAFVGQIDERLECFGLLKAIVLGVEVASFRQFGEHGQFMADYKVSTLDKTCDEIVGTFVSPPVY